MQDLDDFETQNPNFGRCSIVSDNSMSNMDLCVPSTPKLTSVDSICRQNELEKLKTEATQPEKGFLNRVVFDRAEILRKHYQIEKTDKELIEETLDHFNKRFAVQTKNVNELDPKSMVSLKPKIKSVNKYTKSIDPLERNNEYSINKNMKNELSVETLINSVNQKKGGKSNRELPENINVNHDNHRVIKKALVSFNNISAICSNEKRFPLEAREPDSAKGKVKEQSFAEVLSNEKMEFSIDNQLLKRFEEVKANEDINLFEVNNEIALFKLGDTSSNQRLKNCVSIIIDDQSLKDAQGVKMIKREGKKESFLNNKITDTNENDVINLSKNKKPNFKRIRLDSIKYANMKTRILKTDTDCYDKNTNSSNELNMRKDNSLCEHKCNDNSNSCFCDKFKRMADRLNMNFDNNFVRLVYESLFKTNNENRFTENENLKENQSKVKLFSRKNNEEFKFKSNRHEFKTNNENNINIDLMNDNFTNNPIDMTLRAKIDRLKAFKKHFMKTDKLALDAKGVSRKQSNELNSFR